MSNDKKDLEKKLIEKATEKYNNEIDSVKENLKEKGITIEKAVEMYPIPSFLDFHYIATEYKEGEEPKEDEYIEKLDQASRDNYRYLKEAYDGLTIEEKTLFYKYYSLSYLAECYEDILDVEDALGIISINISDKLESLRPTYSYTKKQVRNYFIEEGFNPRKSTMLKENNRYLEELTDNMNNEVADHSKPYSFDDINNKTKENEGLEYKYLLFCEEYLKRGKITETCEYLGIGRATAYRWLELEDVKNYINSRKEELEREAKERSKALFNKCYEELEHTIEHGYTQEKLKAIDIFLKHHDNNRRIEKMAINED